MAIVSADHPYFQLRQQAEQARVDLNSKRAAYQSERSQLRARAMAVIESVTTVKRLLEVWPEIHEFLPEENAGPSGGVPAVLISDLNQQFGLTKGDA